MEIPDNSLEAELEEIKRETEINLIDNINSKTATIYLRKSVVLQIFLTQNYPNEKPIGVKLFTYDLTNLKAVRQQTIEDFVLSTQNDLSFTLSNAIKCRMIDLYSKAKQCVNDSVNKEFLLQTFEILEASPTKYHIFKGMSQNVSSLKENKKKKGKEKECDEDVASKNKFKGSEFIFDRIKWDESIDKDQVIIGYLDRFKGICEIEFNDFKGVHEDKEGIPLHRIRYFKINNHIVWDRESKIDHLTGGDIEKYFIPKSKIVEKQQLFPEPIKAKNDTIQTGNILKFMIDDWILEETKLTDKKPSFVNNLKFLSYNIMSRNNFKKGINESIKRAKHSGGIEPLLNIDRMSKIIDLFEKSKPDFILLQECESYEEQELKESKFIQENYFILNDDSESSCVILSKLKPVWLKTLKLCDSSNKRAQVCKFQFRTNSLRRVEELIICNLHLTSGKANNFFEKRKSQLKTLREYFIDSDEFKADYTLIGGDFNFGEEDNESKLENELLKEIFISNGFTDLMPDVFSFDPLGNYSAAITSFKMYPRRLDRLFFKQNESKCELIRSNLVNKDPFQINLDAFHHITFEAYLNVLSQYINTDSKKAYYLHPSDHYGLEVEFKFKASLHEENLFHQSTIAVVVPNHLSKEIQEIRAEFDPQISRWPPHFNLLYPFYLNIDFNLENEPKHVIGDLMSCLSKFEPFKCRINKMKLFDRNNVVYLEPCNTAQLQMKSIYSELKELFEDFNHKKWKDTLTPHLTIAQPVDKRTAPKGWAKTKYELIKDNLIDLEFDIDCLYWMTRINDEPFKIKYSLPLGKRYPSTITNLSLNNLESNSIIRYLTSVNMILNEQEENNAKVTFEHLLKEINNQQDQLTTKFQTIVIGSFLFSVKCSDFDIVIVKSDSNETKAFSKDLAYNLAQNANMFHIVRNVADANVPIIELYLNSNQISSADIQIYNLPSDQIDFYDSYDYMKKIEKSLVEYAKIFPVSGLFENYSIRKFINNYKDFQILLTFIKHWAKRRQIYGKAFGYLGGISWSLMITVFLRNTFDKFQHNLEIDYSDNRFRDLIFEFFKFYSTRRDFYKHEPISLIDAKTIVNSTGFKQEKTSITILQSVYPYHNTSKNVNDPNRNIIFDEIERAYKMLSQSLSYETVCKELEVSPQRISFKIEIESAKNIGHIFSLIKAKIQGLVTNLQRICQNQKIRTLTNLDEINPNLFYYYISFYEKLDLDQSSKQMSYDSCNNFINTIKSLAHISEYDIKLDIF